ncbi:MAG: MipA/OmpV family protein [Pseudomonadota bacterium]
MGSRIRVGLSLVTVVLAGWMAAAGAQEPGQSPPAQGGAPSAAPTIGWSTDVGFALIANPEFQGSDSYRVLPVPYFDLRYSDQQGVKYFANIPQGFGGYLKRDRGPRGATNDIFVSIAPGFANREVEDVDGIDEFGTAAELRVGWEFARGGWSLNTTLAQALASGHEGMYLDVGASRRGRIGSRGFWSVGPRLRIADSQYMDALYGVTSSEAAASGLDAFDAGAGLESAGLQGAISVPVGKRWRATTVMGVSRLLSDAADSTLIESSNQVFFLTALTTRF